MSEDPRPDPAKIGGLAAEPEGAAGETLPNGERKASNAPVARDPSAEIPVGSGPAAGSGM
jgi:hypothetical protein